MSDLLLKEFNTPFNTIPFNDIDTEDFLPAIKTLIDQAKIRISEISNSSDAPTFENTILELERAGRKLGIVSGAFFNLNHANTSERIEELAQEISPLLSDYGNDITLNEKLFERIKAIHDDLDQLGPEESQYTEKIYKDFTRNGALLDSKGKEELRELDRDLSKLSLEFSQNVLAETNAYELLVEDEKDLAGLPKGAIEAAAELAESKGKKGWAFTLQFPSLVPFLSYCENRQLREEMQRASASRCNKDNKHNNIGIVKTILEKRYNRAKLLGFINHAHFVLENRMASKVETVENFLSDLYKKAIPKGKEDVRDVEKFAKDSGLNEDLQAWDYAFYSEKLKKKVLDFDDEEIKPYFELESTIQGMFTVANKLFGLTFKENSEIQKYHEDVKVYEVYDEKDGELISIFYGDFYPRASKKQGAWMTSYREQYFEGDRDIRPHVSIVCNFPKPTKETPSLLNLRDLTTLFHEFGHALHGMLSKVKYQELSGTNVKWDFVELPSQILENWCYEKECLDLFAKHYKTGEKISAELIGKIKRALQFQEGKATLRQLSFATIDMKWHTVDPSSISDIYQFERDVMKDFDLVPPIEGSVFSAAFSHIFAGGYSAGYYSYKWAEVLDADAFESFKEKGIFNPEVANSFRENILSKGNSEHPMKLFEAFKGRAPEVDPLLRRAGLI